MLSILKFSSNSQIWPPKNVKKLYITRFNCAWNYNFYEGQQNRKPIWNQFSTTKNRFAKETVLTSPNQTTHDNQNNIW